MHIYSLSSFYVSLSFTFSLSLPLSNCLIPISLSLCEHTQEEVQQVHVVVDIN